MPLPFQTLKDVENSKVVIIDYGLGNLRSMKGAVERVGYPVVVSGDHQEIASATKLILPGVGAFGDGMKNLHALGLVDVLNDAVLKKKVPILGVCLGCQLFASEGFEFGHNKGLGWIEGAAIKIEPNDKHLRVPHVGWDEFHQLKADPLYKDIPNDSLFYFVHSYFIDCKNPDLVIGRCDYGVSMSVVFRKENIYGTQFHPEKSQLQGLVMLKNFLDL